MKLFRNRGAAVALLLLFALMLLPTVAAAHQRLLRTTPSRDSTVAEVPRELRLSFYEPVQLAFTTLRLIGPDGSGVALGALRVDPDSAGVLIAPIIGHLQAGTYVLQWASASRDGHPVQGEFGFSIADDAAGLHDEHSAHPGGELGAAAAAPGQGPTNPGHHDASVGPGSLQADAPAYVVIRWANYLGILSVIGAVAFRLLVLAYVRRRTSTDAEVFLSEAAHRAALVGLVFAAFTLLTGMARLYAQSVAMHGAEFALSPDRVLMMLQRTVWGWAWLLQMGAAGLALVGFAIARGSHDPAAGAWSGAAVAAFGLAITPALSGHAAAMTGTTGALAIVTHTLHVIAVGGWLGSLLVLLLAGVPAAAAAGGARRGEHVAHLVRAFSPTALLFAALLVASGLLAAVLHSSSLDALFSSRYGYLLFIKLGIFLLVLGTGAYNFLKVQPALGDEASARHLKRSAAVELAIAAAVLMVTAVLVATARPYEEEDQFAADKTHTRNAEVRAAESPRW